MFVKLAVQSLLDRKASVVLSIMAMTISIFVLLGVEHVRYQAKENFSSAVSGVDLIVGARTGSLNLLLYSVFRIGEPTSNIRWDSYQAIANRGDIKWAVPLSLGDSHKGFRVLGTTADYFQHYSYGNQRRLAFASGGAFHNVLDVVLGARVAKQLGYQLGDTLALAHGTASTSFSIHDDQPFTVVGILSPTGTPVDQTLFVSLQGIEAIHLDWQQGTHKAANARAQNALQNVNLQPESITAFMLGLDSKMAIFGVQRAINNYSQEPLMAILPGVALSELWQTLAIVENTLRLLSALVFAAACLGVSAMLLLSIRERDREIQLLRVIGAPPFFLFFLIELEALLITIASAILAAALLVLCLALSADYLVSHFGLHVSMHSLSPGSLSLIAALVMASLVVGLLPGVSVYARSRAQRLWR